MSRLIDADLLEEILDVNIQKLQDEIDDARTEVQKIVYEAQLFSTMEMIRVIKEQPTVIDMFKVIGYLEKLKNRAEKQESIERYIAYDRAIDIVRGRWNG